MDRPEGMRAIDTLTGVVLCGGESRRMGSDKGLLVKDGRPWALYMAAKLPKMPVLFSINARQTDAYAAILPAGRWVVDSEGKAGPLEGLLSVHRHYPEADLFLLACDMLDLDQSTIGAVIDAYRNDRGGHDFYVYGQTIGGRFLAQPLCGIYTAPGLKALYGSYSEKADDLSLQTLLRKGRTCRMSIADMDAFRNYNS